jgi:predicted nucleic acid-binding protein
MVFVDTSAWFAAVVPSDPNHPHAANWLATNSEVLITTDYIIDETLTLLRARGERQRAKLLGQKFFEASIAEIYFLTEADVRQAWGIFEQYDDKGWSFTDCASKVLIDEMNISRAFAFDHHFHQFGTVHVVPNE